MQGKKHSRKIHGYEGGCPDPIPMWGIQFPVFKFLHLVHGCNRHRVPPKMQASGPQIRGSPQRSIHDCISTAGQFKQSLGQETGTKVCTSDLWPDVRLGKDPNGNACSRRSCSERSESAEEDIWKCCAASLLAGHLHLHRPALSFSTQKKLPGISSCPCFPALQEVVQGAGEHPYHDETLHPTESAVR